MDWEWDSKFGHHGKSPFPLPLYHLICCETNMMVIKFILFFIPNVSQKPISTIIILLILCPNEKNKLHSYKKLKDVHIYNLLKNKVSINLIKNEIWISLFNMFHQWCSKISFPNVLQKPTSTIIFFLILCPNEKNLNFIPIKNSKMNISIIFKE